MPRVKVGPLSRERLELYLGQNLKFNLENLYSLLKYIFPERISIL